MKERTYKMSQMLQATNVYLGLDKNSSINVTCDGCRVKCCLLVISILDIGGGIGYRTGSHTNFLALTFFGYNVPLY